jgi:glycosyltransferase involved in cell wall biosynthesis
VRICLITPGHLSTNPRLVKEADALAEAGHEVTVLAATYLAWGRETDQGFAERPWRRAPPVPFGPDAPIGPRVVQVIRQRAARALFAAGARTPTIADAAAHPAAPDIAAAAARIPADLYIAHYIAALPAAAHAARVHGAAYAFDAEDFHTGETPDGVMGDNPMIAAVERAFLPGAAWLTADSPGVADAYAEAYGLARPVVLLNVFARDEAPAGPTARGAFEPWPSVYWFSQTLGPDRGLEAAVGAIARARSRPHLVLRGLPFRGYDAELQRLAHQVGVADRLHFRPLAAPHEMARLAAEHDLGLAAENGHTLNHRICLGNKIFTYLLAGVPTLLSDVVAHRRLAGELGDAARLYRIDDPETLAAAMDAYLLDPERLAKARAEAFQLGQARFNWDVEKQTLLDLVTGLGPRRHPSPLAPHSALLPGGDPLAAPPGQAPADARRAPDRRAGRGLSGAQSGDDRRARSTGGRGMRVCLITPGHLSTNPRLVKEADALADAGHDVTVLAASYQAWGRETDQVFADRPWRRAPPVAFGPDLQAGRRVLQVGRQRAARALFAAGAHAPAIAAAAAHPAASDLAAAAARIPADLYIAHYIAALPAAAHAARVHGAAYAFDAEDFHTGETPDGVPGDNPMIAAVERAFLPGAAWLTAASPGIADAYVEAYGLARPGVLLNVFPREEAPAGPAARGSFEPGPSVYWFSQTIGPNRGLEAAVGAIARARSQPHLVLRGRPARGYRAKLEQLAQQAGVADRLHFRPLAAPSEMARLAAEHDLGLAAESGRTRNRQIALTNKLFTYLMAGVPTLLSDIEAHRRIADDVSGASRLYRVDDSEALAAAMDAYLLDGAGLARARAEAFRLGQTRFNWDVEKQILLDLVTTLGPTP